MAHGSGTRYEDLALARAERGGLRLVARNYASRYGEIDLILRDGEVLVFAEVRYRRSSRFGGAAASVGSAKRRRLITTASLFLQARPEFASRACRFDVFAMSGDSDAPDIEWHRDAFQSD